MFPRLDCRYALYPDVSGRIWSDVDRNENPYDFKYQDKLGVLGPPNQMYFMEAKSTPGAVLNTRGADPRPSTIRISHRGWEIAEQASAGSESTYVVICLDRVDARWINSGCPRLATVLVDPCALAHPGLSQLPNSTYVPESVYKDGIQVQTSTTSSCKEVKNYPILHGVQTPGTMSKGQ